MLVRNWFIRVRRTVFRVRKNRDLNNILRVHDNFTSSILFHKLQAEQIIYSTSMQCKMNYDNWVKPVKSFFPPCSAAWRTKLHVPNSMNMMKWQAVGSQVNNLLTLLSFIYSLAIPPIHNTWQKGDGIYYFF